MSVTLGNVSAVRLEPGIASLRISDDEHPHMDASFVPELEEAIAQLEEWQDLHAIIVEGGERYFSAGATKQVLVDADPTFVGYYFHIPDMLQGLAVPTIAAMAGHAIGGGFVLGLWCDIAYLAEESLYGTNFMALGFTPGMGATAVVEQAVGGHLGRELLYSGRLIKGREFRANGTPLAHAVHPRAEVFPRALDLARDLVDVPRPSLTLLKTELARRRLADFAAVREAEKSMQSQVFSNRDINAHIAANYGS